MGFFCQWSSLLNPCFCCWARKAQLYEVGDTSPLQGPFAEKTPQQYDDACAACEVVVCVPNEETKARLIAALRYDKRDRGSHGRSLREHFPALGLLQGDRLEPSTYLANVGKLETKPAPCTLLFWRLGKETVCKHRCPLFSVTGVTLLSLSLDILHALNLGVYKAFCCSAIWACIESDVWGDAATTASARGELGARRVREQLFAWYNAQKTTRPFETLHELTDLTVGMIGEQNAQSLSTKAAETGTLLGFCRDLVREHQAKLGDRGPYLVAVGDALVTVRDVMKNSPRRMAAHDVQRLVDAAKQAFILRSYAHIPSTPKWHLMLHIVARARHHGNPTSYATFLDEGANGTVADMARNCHRSTWHISLLAAFAWVSANDRDVRARR